MQKASRSDRTALWIATGCAWTAIAAFLAFRLMVGTSEELGPGGKFSTPKMPAVERPLHPAQDPADV